jgi:hypothetical protein
MKSVGVVVVASSAALSYSLTNVHLPKSYRGRIQMSASATQEKKHLFQDESISEMYKNIEKNAFPYRVPIEQELVSMQQIGIRYIFL